jgi:hypothetical protein
LAPAAEAALERLKEFHERNLLGIVEIQGEVGKPPTKSLRAWNL